MSIPFAIAMGLLFAHELDAMLAKEWRMFPWFKGWSDEAASRVFVAAHVPMLALLLFGLTGQLGDVTVWVLVLNVFCIAHLLMHLLFVQLGRNLFRGIASWTYIAGAAVAAIVDLTITATVAATG